VRDLLYQKERYSHYSRVVAEIPRNLIIFELSDFLMFVNILTIICKYHDYKDHIAVDIV